MASGVKVDEGSWLKDPTPQLDDTKEVREAKIAKGQGQLSAEDEARLKEWEERASSKFSK